MIARIISVLISFLQSARNDNTKLLQRLTSSCVQPGGPGCKGSGGGGGGGEGGGGGGEPFLLISPPMLIYKSSGQSTLSIPSLCLDHRGLDIAHKHDNHSCHRLPFEEESELQGGRWDFPQPERLSLMLIGANRC